MILLLSLSPFVPFIAISAYWLMRPIECGACGRLLGPGKAKRIWAYAGFECPCGARVSCTGRRVSQRTRISISAILIWLSLITILLALNSLVSFKIYASLAG